MKNELPHTHEDVKLEEFLNKEMPDKEKFQIVADIFKMLDDPNRLQIFWILCHVEECVINLAAMLGISSPTLSHHLKQLKSGDLIVSRRKGKEVYYKAADTEEAKMLHHAIEQIMMISCPERQRNACHTPISASEQLTENEKTIQDVHDYLLEHLSERTTIDKLARLFHMNSTTLKSEFKEMYGTSIALHTKEHRMEKAANMLADTDLSVSEIANAVGYTSPSKFSTAFYETFHFSPLEYRKRHAKDKRSTP